MSSLKPLLTLFFAAASITMAPAQDAASATASRPQSAPASHFVSDGEADARANALLNKMTLEEKIDMLGGVDGFFTHGNARLGIPRLKMTDGPLGVRNFGPSTVYAAGIALAATFDPKLAEQVGTQIGRDARAKGSNFQLGPGVDIYRAPMNGRNFEYFGEDPYLAGKIVAGWINGLQSQGVIATVKHYMGNNSEYDRHNTDSEIDPRTMHEIYLPAFEAAVREGHTGAVMNSYNLVNGEHATQNKYINVDVLKGEWKFDGLVMSDWDATYDAVAAANGGLDLEMPSGRFMNRENLIPAIRSGKVSQATIDDKVRRILRTAIRFGMFDRDQQDITVPRWNEEGREVARQGAREGIVLLKNDGNLLPLDKAAIKTIAVIGPDAYPAVAAGGGSARVQGFHEVSFLEGVSNALGTKAKVLYDPGIPGDEDIALGSGFTTAAENGKDGLHLQRWTNGEWTGAPAAESDGPPGVAPSSGSWPPPPPTTYRWTGYYIPKTSGLYRWYTKAGGSDSYTLWIDDQKVLEQGRHEGQVPQSKDMQLEAGHKYKIRFDYRQQPSWLASGVLLGVLPQDKWVNQAALEMAKLADAVVLCVGYDAQSESEGSDRSFALPPNQNELIQRIAAVNKNTIVVVTSGGNVDMQSWINNVPGLFEAWYPGEEGGNAFAELLFGNVNPSGKLPATFEKRWQDNPAHDSYYPNDSAHGPTAVKYTEGIFVGYRGYEKNHTQPQFPFGYGLSYTTFKIGSVSVTPTNVAAGQDVTVSFDVTNTGQRPGAEVAQLYVGQQGASVPRPAKELKGFSRVELQPGQTQRVTLTLTPRDRSYWDVNSKDWKQDPGQFTVYVGHSSADIDQQVTFTVGR